MQGTAGVDRTVRWLAPAGILFVVAFFGPWLDLAGMVQASGWELARAEHEKLFIYPIGGAVLAATALAGARAARPFAIVFGGLVVFHAAYITFSDLRYGAWMTVVGAVTALIAGCTRDHRGGALAAGALVVAGFFLPWIGDAGVTVSGFDLARLPAAPDELGLPSPAWLYVVPGLGIVALAAALSAKARPAAAAAGVGILGVLAYLYLRTASLVVGWGVWLTLAAGVGALLTGLVLRLRAGR